MSHTPVNQRHNSASDNNTVAQTPLTTLMQETARMLNELNNTTMSSQPSTARSHLSQYLINSIRNVDSRRSTTQSSIVSDKSNRSIEPQINNQFDDTHTTVDTDNANDNQSIVDTHQLSRHTSHTDSIHPPSSLHSTIEPQNNTEPIDIELNQSAERHTGDSTNHQSVEHSNDDIDSHINDSKSINMMHDQPSGIHSLLPSGMHTPNMTSYEQINRVNIYLSKHGFSPVQYNVNELNTSTEINKLNEKISDKLLCVLTEFEHRGELLQSVLNNSVQHKSKSTYNDSIIGQLENKNRCLNDNLDTLKQRLHTLTHDNDKLSKQLRQYNIDNDKQLHKLHSTINQLKHDVQRKSNEVASLNQKLNANKSHHRTSTGLESTGSGTATRHQSNTYDKTTQRLMQLQSQYNNERNELHNEIFVLQNEITKLNNKLFREKNINTNINSSTSTPHEQIELIQQKYQLQLNEQKLMYEQKLNQLRTQHEQENAIPHNKQSIESNRIQSLEHALHEEKMKNKMAHSKTSHNIIEFDKNVFKYDLHKISMLPDTDKTRILQQICIQLQITNIYSIDSILNKLLSLVEILPKLRSFVTKTLNIVNHVSNQQLTSSMLNENNMNTAVQSIQEWSNRLQQYDTLTQFVNNITQLVLSNDSALYDTQQLYKQILYKISEYKQSDKQLHEYQSTESHAHKSIILHSNDTNTDSNTIIQHIQNLFNIKHRTGIYAKINEIYLFITEINNTLNELKYTLNIPNSSSVSNVLSVIRQIVADRATSNNVSSNQLLPSATAPVAPPAAALLQHQIQSGTDQQYSDMIDNKQIDSVSTALKYRNTCIELQRILKLTTIDNIIPVVQRLLQRIDSHHNNNISSSSNGSTDKLLSELCELYECDINELYERIKKQYKKFHKYEQLFPKLDRLVQELYDRLSVYDIDSIVPAVNNILQQVQYSQMNTQRTVQHTDTQPSTQRSTGTNDDDDHTTHDEQSVDTESHNHSAADISIHTESEPNTVRHYDIE